jgi:hypothetical protein
MRRTPYAIGRDHGLNGLPRFHHHVNGRRYDSLNANNAYEWGYGLGTRERIRGASARYDIFDLCGVHAPRQTRPTR